MNSVQQVVLHGSHQVKAGFARPASSHGNYLLLSLGAYPTVLSQIPVTSPPSFWENKPVATGMKLNEEDGGEHSPSARCNGCSTSFYIPFGSGWCQPCHSPATSTGKRVAALMPSARFKGERSDYMKKEARPMLLLKCERIRQAGAMM